MITSKQRSYLRSIANKIEPIFQIGKGGINDNMVKQLHDALEARELIKIHVLNNAEASAKDLCRQLSQRLKAEEVQIIGNKFILYKESSQDPKIMLP